MKHPGTHVNWGSDDLGRARSWIRVINQWLYNCPSEHPANHEDFERHFQAAAQQWRASTSVESIAEAKNALRTLRNKLVEDFDVAADGR